MKLGELNISGYRSIREVRRVQLDQLNIVIGANGSGKTNLYRALELVHSAASGRLARALLEEGGMPAVLWRGDRRKGPVRVSIRIEFDDLDYEIQLGLPVPGQSAFDLDPEVKQERIRLRSGSKWIVQLDRTNTSAWVRDENGRRIEFSDKLSSSESVMSELREPARFPVLAMLRAEISGWRFYHRFRTDMGSPIRKPQLAVRTPVLNPDGSDVAAALQTIREVGDAHALSIAVGRAFPGSQLEINHTGSGFSFGLRMPEFIEPLWQQELSDGMLQYICLLAALLSPRPASLVVLNEPETSLHPEMLPALAALVVDASKYSQIVLTTHSQSLCELIEKQTYTNSLKLEKVKGETRIIGYGLLGKKMDEG
jgi:predicted ATPase